MINIRLATYADFKSYTKMRKDWERDYTKAGDTAVKQTKNEMKDNFLNGIDHKAIFIITVKGQIAGFQDVAYMAKGTSADAFINTMYIKPAFRNQGIAKYVRECAKLSGFKGTIITYGRVQRKLDYFVECGFRAVAEYPEQVGTDLGLCFLLFEQIHDAKPLTVSGLAQSRKAADIKSDMYAKNGGNNNLTLKGAVRLAA